MKVSMKYKMRKMACTPFDGQAKLHEECGVFGVYVNKEDIGKMSDGPLSSASALICHEKRFLCFIAENNALRLFMSCEIYVIFA